jgi:hypothetical protein
MLSSRNGSITTVAVGLLTLLVTGCGSPHTSSTGRISGAGDAPKVSVTSATPTTTSTIVSSSTTVATTTSTTFPTSVSTTTAQTISSSTTCSTSVLMVSATGPNGATGTITYILYFKNIGTTTCSLNGFPGVSFISAAGAQVGSPASRSASTPVQVMLSPSESALTTLNIEDPGVAGCTATSIQGLRVYPPNETASSTVKLASSQDICSSGLSPGLIGPVQPVSQ